MLLTKSISVQLVLTLFCRMTGEGVLECLSQPSRRGDWRGGRVALRRCRRPATDQRQPPPYSGSNRTPILAWCCSPSLGLRSVGSHQARDREPEAMNFVRPEGGGERSEASRGRGEARWPPPPGAGSEGGGRRTTQTPATKSRSISTVES